MNIIVSVHLIHSQTATAIELVQLDINNVLRIEPKVISTKIDRPNLEYIINKKTTISDDIFPILRQESGSSIIIYVAKKGEAADLAAELKKNGFNCEYYHSDVDIDERSRILENFLEDEFKVIVATEAFGRGIDKKNVRHVIHWGAPTFLEK